MAYRLIAIDMDGTLLNSNNEISKRTNKAIEEATKRGIHIVLSTGRILSSAELYADSIGLKNYILASNGAVIRNEEREIIYKIPIEKYAVKQIMEVARKHNAYYHFYDEYNFYTNRFVEEVYEFYNSSYQNIKGTSIGLNIFKDDSEIYDNDSINSYKFLFLDEKMDNLEILKTELSRIENINVSSSWSNNIEIMSHKVSKGLSLKYLSNLLNIDKTEIIAIGDNENDISMIEYAGLGVAMENGEKTTKDIADIIADTNDNDGVAKIIEEYILR